MPPTTTTTTTTTSAAPLAKLTIVNLDRVIALDRPQTRGEAMKRPPRVTIVWGEDLPRFVGVVASVNVKYTMLLATGRPVRATCAVKFIEAARHERGAGR